MGLDRILKAMHAWQSSDVRVGILDDPKLAKRAGGLEYGTETAPARPFMGQALEGEEADRETQRLVGEVLDGRLAPQAFPERIGQGTVDRMRAVIDAGEAAPLAPSTVARKGSAHPRVETGEMRAGLDFEVRRAGS